MYQRTKEMARVLAAGRLAAECEAWLRADGERLADAAELLGGPDWRRRALGAVEALAGGAELADLRDEIEALHGLLTLEPTDDPWSEEALRFLSVDPDDPRADDARLCAEALGRALAALDLLAGAGALAAGTHGEAA